MSVLPWWFIVAIFVVVGLAATVILLRKKAADPRRRPAVLVVGRFLAVVYAAFALIGTVVNALVMLLNSTVEVALPVRQYWPGVYPWVTLDPAPAATVVSGGFTTADVMVQGLGTDARLLLAIGNAVQGLTIVVIAAVVALLCHRLLDGSPFRPLLARATTWAAVAISAGGIAWQVFLEIGGSIASRQVLGLSGWSTNLPSADMSDYVDSHFDSFTSGLPEASMSWNIDFWPLFLGLALAAVAIAFRYSERLQRDTEGLV